MKIIWFDRIYGLIWLVKAHTRTTHQANVGNGWIRTPSLLQIHKPAHTQPISGSSFTSCRGHKTWFSHSVSPPLVFQALLVCTHTPTHTPTHITLLQGCGSTFNAPNYLGPRFSGCCITSGLAGCIFSLEMPLALSPSLSVDWVTTLLLKESNGRLPELPSSNHSTWNHHVITKASRRKTSVH